MKITALVAQEQLELRTVVRGDLEASVEHVTITDLPAPARFLTAGDLVLTSGLWFREDPDAARFVDSVADAGGVGIVLGTASIAAIPEAVARACARQGLALLTVPDHVSYVDLAEAITSLLAGPGGRRPAADLYRRLLSRLTHRADPVDLVALLHQATGIPSLLLSSTGRVLSPSLLSFDGGDLADAFHDTVAQRAGAAGEVRCRRGDRAITLTPVHGMDRDRPPAMYLAMSGRRRDWAEGVAEVAGDVAELLGYDHQRHIEGQGPANDLLAGALDAARAGHIADAEVRLEAIGTDLAARYVVVAATSPGGVHGDELAGVVLDDLAHELTGATHSLAVDGTRLAIVPGLQPDVAARVSAGFEALAPLVRPGRAVVATSDSAAGAGTLAVAIDQALHAHRIAALRPGPIAVAGSQDLGSHVLLLSAVPLDVRAVFRQRLVGVLEEYDGTHSGRLVETLQVFLEESGSWSRAADRLHVHVNTLRYRITRIERLTGRGLATLEERLDFYLALNMPTL